MECCNKAALSPATATDCELSCVHAPGPSPFAALPRLHVSGSVPQPPHPAATMHRRRRIAAVGVTVAMTRLLQVALVVVAVAAATVWDLPPPPPSLLPPPLACEAAYPAPLSATDVVFDWDANCGMNTTDWSWTSKVGGLVANWSALSTSRTVDAARGLARLAFANGKKMTLPVDISPSVYPAFTLEVLFSVNSISTGTYRSLLTTAMPATTTPTTWGRTILLYDNAGAGPAFAPLCTTATGTTSVPVGNGV